MKLRFDLSQTDFRTTPLENIFLDTYLPSASGTALRVYLYGWRHCYHQEEAGMEVAQLARELSLSPEEVDEALRFWENEGLITEHAEEEERIVSFRSLLLLWAGCYEPSAFNAYESNTGTDAHSAGAVPPPLLTPLSATEAQREAVARKKMFLNLENFLSEGGMYAVRFKENEIRQFHDFLDRYGLRPEFLEYAYRRACSMESVKTKGPSYILGTIENWLRYGQIADEQQLDAFLEKAEKTPQRASGRAKKKAQMAKADNRMTKEERKQWIEEKLERSRQRSLRGDHRDE
ncbi:MAG: DnaD domain protein [Ndongobacter sp.]|nr:DnaD domain protein [Ndongobacter sp.]